MFEKSFSLLFYLKRPKNYQSGSMPIYLRITINGIPKEISTKRECTHERWNPSSMRIIGTREESKTINSYLDFLQNKVHEVRRQLVECNQVITAESIKNALKGFDKKTKQILEVFKQHNDEMKNLIGKDYSFGTFQRYQTSFQHTANFIKWKYEVEDLDIQKLNYEFVSQYEYWLKTKRNCDQNTSLKYIANFKKIVKICLKNGWLIRDPFLGFKMIKKEVVPEFLTEFELKCLTEKRFSSDRLTQVRDIFLFCCLTGLAFADVSKLKNSEIGIGVDGNKWIFTQRKKTKVLSRIPLLPSALTIIDKYESNEVCINSGKLLPVLSNQKYNEYLKEIASICSINKRLTTHTARHTFATTVTLSNGVPIESVSKMLGHKNLKTTQHYARVLDNKIGEDMRKLKELIQLQEIQCVTLTVK